MEEVFITNSAEETQKIAKEFLTRTVLVRENGFVLALYGDLGSGKTTFVQGIAQGLGIKQRIVSPTFIIARQYRIKNHESRIMNFYHIDLYRIDSAKDIQGLGLEEILNDKNAIVTIEWAEKLGSLLPNKRIDIYFEYLSENKRKINIT